MFKIWKTVTIALLGLTLSLSACNNGSSSSHSDGGGVSGETGQGGGENPESPDDGSGPIVSPQSAGYFMAQLESTKHDLKKKVRVFVAGMGGGAGLLFQEAAISKAKKVKEAFPQDQILLVFYNEAKVSSQTQKLVDWGLKHVEQHYKDLSDELIYQSIRDYKEVRSIDVFSHSTYDYALLSETGAIFDRPSLKELKALFSVDATVQFHGCNTGWGLAPALAKTWGVPVSGALTSTNFEQLHSNGNFYFNDAITKPEGAWAKENKLSFNTTVSCKSGGCLRMKPDNQPYYGLHGKLDSGLSFYKFFCGELSRHECNRRMAFTIPEFMDLAPSKEGKQKSKMISTAQNVLCPIHKSKDWRETCRKGLKAAETGGNKTFSMFQGISLHCGNNKCSKDTSSKSTAFVDEYLNYLNGIEYITTGHIKN